MSRLPPKPRDQQTPQEQECHDMFARVLEKSVGPNGSKFKFKDGEDTYNGPFPFFLAAPNVGKILHDLLIAVARLKLPADARETAIVTVGAQFLAGYEIYSHTPQLIEAGLTKEQADVLKRGGSKPEGLNERCSVAYDMAHHLTGKRGPLPQEIWDRSILSFGNEGTVALMHYIGLYSYVSTALNAMDAPVPE